MIQHFYYPVSFFLGQAAGREGQGAEETRCLLQRAAGSAGREGKPFFFPFHEEFSAPFCSRLYFQDDFFKEVKMKIRARGVIFVLLLLLLA